jgi:hypothetical protein
VDPDGGCPHGVGDSAYVVGRCAWGFEGFPSREVGAVLARATTLANTRMRALTLILVGSTLASCAAGLENPERFAECNPGRVEQIFMAKCGACHGAVEPDAFLDLVSPGVASRVIGISSTTEACEGRTIVETTEQPHLLLDKIGGQPSCGARMPLGLQALSATEVECVRRWIDDALAGGTP